MVEAKATTLELVQDGDAKEGDVRALFATLNAVDKDNDVTVIGAFENGASVKMASYGHKLGELPVGRGEIFADDESAKMQGRFFVNTTHGKDTYLTVKEMGELQEWSYEYDVLESEDGTHEGQPVRILKKLKVHGVTPVYIGAGVDTQTLDIKSDASLTEHGDTLAQGLDEYVTRVKNRAQYRAKEGRTLSSSNRNRLSALVAQLETTRAEIAKLLEETDPARDEAGKGVQELARLFADFQRVEARLNGVVIPTN